MPISLRAIANSIPSDHCRQVDAYYYVDRLRPSDVALRFLDIGAGDGRSVDVLRRNVPDAEWTGVDIEDSPEVRSRKRTDCAFLTYDGVNIPFGDEYFDVVYSRQVFEHVRYPELLLADIRRVLKKGGVFIGSVSQLEPFHSYSFGGFTYYGFTQLACDAGLQLAELRPGIDGITLTLRNLLISGLGAADTKRTFASAFTSDSGINRIIQQMVEGGSGAAEGAQKLAEICRILNVDVTAEQLLKHRFRDTSVRGKNLTQLRYSGHFCFEFTRPVA